MIHQHLVTTEYEICAKSLHLHYYRLAVNCIDMIGFGIFSFCMINTQQPIVIHDARSSHKFSFTVTHILMLRLTEIRSYNVCVYLDINVGTNIAQLVHLTTRAVQGLSG